MKISTDCLQLMGTGQQTSISFKVLGNNAFSGGKFPFLHKKRNAAAAVLVPTLA
jgi:hypothetical protein